MNLKLVSILILFLSSLSFTIPGQTFVKAPNKIADEFTSAIFHNQNQISYPVWESPFSFNVEDISITLSEVDPSARTLYNYQSNCSPQLIMQNPANASHLHAIFMVAVDTTFTTLNDRYFYSTNGGTNWAAIGNVATSSHAGYGNLTLLNNGRAVIAMNSREGGDNRAQLYVDLYEGSGSFSRLDPGGSISAARLYPRCVSTNNNQIVFYSGGDSVFKNMCISISGGGTFSGYVFDPNPQAYENYTLARSGSKVCAAFVTGHHSTHAYGSVIYIESTDNGVTWGSPVTVREANYGVGSDSLGAFKGVDVVYYNNQPAIIFGLAPQDPAGSYFPNAFASIYFWTQAVGLVRLDSLPRTTCMNYIINDGLVAVCRPTIGLSSDGLILYAAWMHARPDSSRQSAPFFDVYFSYSTNGGAAWAYNIQVTNPPSTPLKDNRWPSISKTNNLCANIIYQQCDSAGSYVNGGPKQWAKMMLAKICSEDAIKPISKEIPFEYFLSQNFPNPFNPATIIKFALPHNDKVSIKIYDVEGRLISVLLKNENVSAGIYEVEFNASGLASGIYFYKIQTEKFNSTKKMLMIK